MKIKRTALAAAVLALAACSSGPSQEAQQASHEKQACQVLAGAVNTPQPGPENPLLAQVQVELGHPPAGYFSPAFTRAWEAVVPASVWPTQGPVDTLQRLCDALGVTTPVYPARLVRQG